MRALWMSFIQMVASWVTPRRWGMRTSIRTEDAHCSRAVHGKKSPTIAGWASLVSGKRDRERVDWLTDCCSVVPSLSQLAAVISAPGNTLWRAYGNLWLFPANAAKHPKTLAIAVWAMDAPSWATVQIQGEKGIERGRQREKHRNWHSFLHRLRGKFYLETNDAKPFGRHVSTTSSFIPQPPIPYKMPAKNVNVDVAEDEDENNTLSNNIALTWQNVPKQSGGSSCHFSLLPTL